MPVFARIVTGPPLLFSYFLCSLSLKNFGRLGGALGMALLYLHFRRNVVDSNLNLALGSELTLEERNSLRKSFYQGIGRTFLEIVRNFSLTRQQMQAELELSESDRARLAEVQARGKGLILVSGHIANWELLAMGVAAHGYPVAVVVKRMSNGISQFLIERQRSKTGMEVIYSGGAIEKMKTALKAGKFIGFMVDQNTTGKKGIRANFFRVPASSIRGLAGLVRDTGCAVIPICAFRQPDGKHRVQLLDELPYLTADNLPAGSQERALREEWLNTQQYQSAVETLVRMHPEQWLWIHRRWKTSRVPLQLDVAHLENRA